MFHNFKSVYEKKTDSELLDIYKNGKDRYEDGVFKAIEEILKERNVSFENKDLLIEKDVINLTISKTPLYIGLLSIFIAYIIVVCFRKDERTVTLAVYAIIVRSIFLIYGYSLMRIHKTDFLLLRLLCILFTPAIGLIILYYNIVNKGKNNFVLDENIDFRKIAVAPVSVMMPTENRPLT
jgi:hypothetical protein